MGWWEQHDGTVIGDELADLVGDHLEEMVKELVGKYPTISRKQVLHTMAFCSGYLKHFDKGREVTDSDGILAVMTVRQRREFYTKHSVPPDMSKRIAPGTSLTNVHNPFEE